MSERKTPWTPGPWFFYSGTGTIKTASPESRVIASGVERQNGALLAEAPAMAELLAALCSIEFNGSEAVDKACDVRDAARALRARIGAP